MPGHIVIPVYYYQDEHSGADIVDQEGMREVFESSLERLVELEA